MYNSQVVDGPLLGEGFAPIIVDHYVILCRKGCITVLSNKTGALLFDVVGIEFTAVAASGSSLWLGQNNGSLQEHHISNTELVLKRTVRITKGETCSVEHLCLDENHVYCVVCEKDSKKRSLHHILRSLDSDDWTESSITLGYKVKHDDALFLVQSEHGVVIGHKKSLRLFNHRNQWLDLSSCIRGTITSLDSYVTDVVVGLKAGAIQVICDVWSLTFRKGVNVASCRVIRKVHWHAHAVSCVRFDSSGRMHSAGEESVWVTWDSSSNKPVKMLPRVCVGPIDHLVFHEDTMLIYCGTENSVRAYEMYNQRLIWKHIGYCGRPVGETKSNLSLTADKSKNALITPGTPGKLNLYDPDQRRVVAEWVVCPYNHVSRIDQEDIPRPYIVAAATFEGASWMTAHVTPSQVGPQTTCLQFWNAKKEKTAVMSHPHGKLDPIQSLAMHESVAVSIAKKNFMLWHRVGQRSWTCSSKVTIPSGYSNLERGATPVFSADGSVLALAFGKFVTLWSTDASSVTFLSSIPMESAVQQVVFCSSRHIVDMLLVSTETDVHFMTVAGVQWWKHRTSIAHRVDALWAPHNEMICVAECSKARNTSSVLVLDAVTGIEKERITDIKGRVISIAAMEDEPIEIDIWDGDEVESSGLDTMNLFVETSEGDLVQLRQKETKHESKTPAFQQSAAVPRLPTLDKRSKKRRLMDISEMGVELSEKRVSLAQFASLEDEQEVEDLPLLRGAFVTAFLGRNILRRKG